MMVGMSYLQPRPQNPIQLRKDAVRRYSRNAVVWTGGGIVAGAALGILANSWPLFVIIALVGAVAGFINWRKVQHIVNYQDPQ